MPNLQTFTLRGSRNKKGFAPLGFTLIELLITVAVLAVLMAVVIVVLDPAGRFEEARDSNRRQLLSRIAEAMESCYIIQTSVTACDTVTELVALGFLESSVGAEVTGTRWVCTTTGTFCISANLESVTGTSGYFKYTRAAGKPALGTVCAGTAGGCY